MGRGGWSAPLPRFVIYGPILMKFAPNERAGNFTSSNSGFCYKTKKWRHCDVICWKKSRFWLPSTSRLPRFVIYGPIWMKLTANERGGNFTPRFCDKTRNNVTMTSFVKIMRGKLSVSDCTYHLWVAITQLCRDIFLIGFHQNVEKISINDKLKRFSAPIFRF